MRIVGPLTALALVAGALAPPAFGNYGFRATHHRDKITITFKALWSEDEGEDYSMSYWLSLDGPGKRCDDEGEFSSWEFEGGRLWLNGRKANLGEAFIDGGQRVRFQVPDPNCVGMYRAKVYYEDEEANSDTVHPIGSFKFTVRTAPRFAG